MNRMPLKAQLRQRWICVGDERMPLTALEVSVLRIALELAGEYPDAVHERLVRNTLRARRFPSVARVRACARGVLHYLLIGQVEFDYPNVAEWRAERIAAALTRFGAHPACTTDESEDFWSDDEDEKCDTTASRVPLGE